MIWGIEGEDSLSELNGGRDFAARSDEGLAVPAAPTLSDMGQSYGELIARVKDAVRHTQVSVMLHANAEMTALYWKLGKMISDAQHKEGWGAKVIDRVSLDLQKTFPGMKGFSASNIKYMKRFAEAWPDGPIGQRPVDQLPWGSNIVLLTKLKDSEERLWYAQEARKNGWSRSVLALQIDADAKGRSGKAPNNFASTLPPDDSDLARQVFKDPYLFDFLGNDVPRRELEIEQRLTDHIQDFLLELGRGFAFVGRQVPLEVGSQTFRLDMLFYHLKLRCYVVVELKACEFEPGFVGQLNLYRNAVDELFRHPDDGKTIGLLLVRGKDNVVVKYALEGMENPLGVAKWDSAALRSLPDGLKSSLPTVEEIEREINDTSDVEKDC